MVNYSSGDFASIIKANIGTVIFALIFILLFLPANIRKLFPNLRLPNRGPIASIAAWWSGLTFELQQILQWMIVIIGSLWLIAATCLFGVVEVLFLLNPEGLSGNLLPPQDPLVAFCRFGFLFFLFGIMACGIIQFNEGYTKKLLDILKKAAIYLCICLSSAGFIFVVVAAIAFGQDPVHHSLLFLPLVSAGSAVYLSYTRSTIRLDYVSPKDISEETPGKD